MTEVQIFGNAKSLVKDTSGIRISSKDRVSRTPEPKLSPLIVRRIGLRALFRLVCEW